MTSVRVIGLLCLCFFGLIASDPAPANAIDDEELAGWRISAFDNCFRIFLLSGKDNLSFW
jgi:hypothetical protein